jgi:hypothetical protein
VNPPFRHPDDQIYPGLHLRPYAMHDNVSVPFQNPKRLTSFMRRPSPPPPAVRSTWKKRFNLNRRAGIEQSKQIESYDDAFQETQASHEPRNVLKRAVDTLKKKKLASKRSSSFDLDLVPSARPSYLPDQESLQQRVKEYKGSLDSHFDSLRAKKAKQHLVSAERGTEQLGKISSNSTQRRQGNALPSTSSPILKSGETINVVPVSEHLTLGSQARSPLLPLKLHPPTTWGQNVVGHYQDKQLPMEPLQLPGPVKMPMKPQPKQIALPPRPTAGPQIIANQEEEEWRHLRNKAIKKCEDWVLVSNNGVTSSVDLLMV